MLALLAHSAAENPGWPRPDPASARHGAVLRLRLLPMTPSHLPEPVALPWHPGVPVGCSKLSFHRASISSSLVEIRRGWGWTLLGQDLRLSLSRASCQAQQRMRCKMPRVWVWFSPWSWFSAGLSLHKNLEENQPSPTMALERSFRNTWRSATGSLSPSSLGSVYI